MSILHELNTSHKRQQDESEDNYNLFLDYLHGIIERHDINDDIFINGRFEARKKAVKMREQAIRQRSLKGQREVKYGQLRDIVEAETDRMFRIAEGLGVKIEARLENLHGEDTEQQYAIDKMLPTVRSYLDTFKTALTTSLDMLGVE